MDGAGTEGYEVCTITEEKYYLSWYFESIGYRDIW